MRALVQESDSPPAPSQPQLAYVWDNGLYEKRDMQEFKENVRPEFVSALDKIMVASTRGEDRVMGWVRRGLKLNAPVRV